MMVCLKIDNENLDFLSEYKLISKYDNFIYEAQISGVTLNSCLLGSDFVESEFVESEFGNDWIIYIHGSDEALFYLNIKYDFYQIGKQINK